MEFREYFWNAELCNFSGFDTLCQRLQKGRKLCKEYLEYLKIKIHAQEAHGKMLIKLSKLPLGKDETGTLRQSWEVLRMHTESVGREHLATANAIHEEASKLEEFVLDQKKTFKKQEEGVRKMQSKLKNAFRRVQETKKVYYAKCREAESQQDMVAEVTGKSGLTMKDLEKKAARSQQTAEQADACYVAAIEELNSIKQKWETVTEEACDVFQSLEEERIKFLRNSLWLVMNLSSLHCVNEDLMNENMRSVLEKCDEKHDMEVVVRLQKTGTDRPAPYEYEPYQNCSSQECGSNISEPLQNVSSFQNTGEKLKKFFKDSLGNSHKKDSTSMSYTVNDLYETIDAETVPQLPNAYKVQYEYAARQSDELTLMQNEVVKVISHANEDWWEVETQDKKRGVYPAMYLSPQEYED